MSFSSSVKDELCGLEFGNPNVARAEAYGLLLFCNRFNSNGIRITTRSQQLKIRLYKLFNYVFDLKLTDMPNKLSFEINDVESIQKIQDTFEIDCCGSALHINYGILGNYDCYSAFCRGAFLSGGSVTDPEKAYHLELSTVHRNIPNEIQALLYELDLNAKVTQRQSNYIIYFKNSEIICKFLNTIGASESASKMLAEKQRKRLLNSVQRQYNCDVANVEKAFQSSMKHIEAIEKLKRAEQYDDLPAKLRETAELRVNNPELSLIQLANAFTPPVSKSCLNHRLNKIIELADKCEK